MKSPQELSPNEPCACATLPSGRVLVFDKRGRVIDQFSGTYGSVKQLVFRTLLATGQFFWMAVSVSPVWRENTEGGMSAVSFEASVTAIHCTADNWLDGGKYGQPVGRASWSWPNSRKQEIPANEIWKMIREAALAPSA